MTTDRARGCLPGAAAAACLILCLLSCTGTGNAGIDRLLDTRARALSIGDLSLYMSCISKDYRDGGRDYESLRREMAGYLASPGRIELRVSGRKIYRDGVEATVFQHVRLKVTGPDGRTRNLEGTERLLLHRETSGWRIRGGLLGGGSGGGACAGQGGGMG